MNFIEYINKNNKIKSASSVEDLYSENIFDYIDNFINDGNVKYNNYNIGDLVFVNKYKYKNGQDGVNHIFLIVDIYEGISEVNYYGMLLSSKLHKLKFAANKLILKDNKNNLRKNSIIKTDIIYKIFTKNILIKIGNIDKNKVDMYKKFCMSNI